MQEQAMVNDALNSINAGLKSMGDMISQAENQELRQTLQKMRNDAETCQYELFTIAKSKNYYQPAQQATQDEIMNVKNFVSSQGSQSGQSGQAGQSGQSNMSNQSNATGQSNMSNQSNMTGQSNMSNKSGQGQTR